MMNEDQILAKVGRLTMLSEKQDENYTYLIRLLAGVVDGSIDRERVLVNLTDRTWALAAEGQRPGRPAQVNGLPLVAVAPEPNEHPRREPPDELAPF
jgi:hypothetical protein